MYCCVSIVKIYFFSKVWFLLDSSNSCLCSDLVISPHMLQYSPTQYGLGATLALSDAFFQKGVDCLSSPETSPGFQMYSRKHSSHEWNIQGPSGLAHPQPSVWFQPSCSLSM